MAEKYLKDQLWKIYEKLPEGLREAIFSPETADTIDNICKRNQIPENQVSEIAKYTGRVLSGLLPPNEFEKALVSEVKLKNGTAKNVAREISRFVFFPVKEELSKLYDVEIAPPARPPEVVKQKIEKKPDSYRESFE